MSSVGRLSVIGCMAVGSVIGWAQAPEKKQTNRPPLPTGAVVHRDLAYIKDDHPRHGLDLYLPTPGTSKPVLVVWVHGGGWQKGSKEAAAGTWLLEHGFAFASINYRLSEHAIFPAQIQDCQAAIRWLRAKAGAYGYNAERIGVWGASAGGHLVALLGAAGDTPAWSAIGDHQEVSCQVQAVVDWFGPTDFTNGDFPDHAKSPICKLLGGACTEKPDLAKQASPIAFVTRNDPPVLIMHGDKDPLVPLQQSQHLIDRLNQAGVTNQLIVFPGAGHGGPDFTKPETQQAIRQFFQQHLQKKAG